MSTPMRAKPLSREHVLTARQASLRYVCCADAGIRRVKRGKGFVYFTPDGKRLRDAAELQRIRSLALPPAWTDVWICPDPHGHLQATGFDAKGRKQYRYDTRWRVARDATKYDDLREFAGKLPSLRRALRRDLSRPGLSRDKVLATLVSLMARTGVRVGNDRYHHQNGSFGLTTLLDRHAKFHGGTLELEFKGKGGKPYRTIVHDATLARIVRRCRDVPGQRLFQYVDAAGAQHWVGAGDVNEYVHRLTGARFTAKTFRTWLASVSALAELRKLEPAASLTRRKRQLNTALSNVAERLGNTLAICRKSYVHPYVSQAFLDDQLPPPAPLQRSGLSRQECDLVSVLTNRAARLSRAARLRSDGPVRLRTAA
jgi:DNA topoisomerase I